MKHMKMLGLAAIAALGLMAFVGAGTASATTLATDAAGTVHYAVGTVIEGSLETGTSATLTNTSGETIATCTKSATSGSLEGPETTETNKVKYPSGTWVGGKQSKLTWESCNQTTDTVNGGSLEIMQVGTKDEGEVVSKNAEVTINIFGVSCTYGTGEGTNIGTIVGGEAPTLKITAVVPRVSGGFLCPSTGIWHAAYIITSPHAVHVVS